MTEIPTEPPEMPERRRVPSLLLVNTGDGKGKSTAAFGTVLRAVGRGWRAAVVQFLKSGEWRVGEEKVCRELGVDWYAAGDGFTWDSADLDESRGKAVAAWDLAKQLIAAGDHQLIVLDEITYPMIGGWIASDEVVAVLKTRPETVNVICTGRGAPDALIDAADTVTEMRNVKHAFDTGVLAKRGIDY